MSPIIGSAFFFRLLPTQERAKVNFKNKQAKKFSI